MKIKINFLILPTIFTLLIIFCILIGCGTLHSVETNANIGQYEDDNLLILFEPLENTVFLEGADSWNDFDFIIKIVGKENILDIVVQSYSINFFETELFFEPFIKFITIFFLCLYYYFFRFLHFF
jgi:hypothetical protein